MTNNQFKTSNLSWQRTSVKYKKRSKTWKNFVKICLTIIWIILIFFLSVWFISWFKWLFDNVKQAILSTV